MTLIEQIKAAQLAARKNRDAATASTLTTLIGEAEMIGKNANRIVHDLEVTAIVKKFIDNIKFTLEQFKLNPAAFQDGVEKHLSEKALLQKFLPEQLDLIQLTNIIVSIKTEIGATTQKDMGKLMALLKSRHEGTYDGKMAASIVKTALQ